jgi:hypothetical protein
MPHRNLAVLMQEYDEAHRRRLDEFRAKLLHK